MVWAAITADGRSPLEFIDRGVKINAEYYRESMLESASLGHANISAADLALSNRTQKHHTQQAPPKNGLLHFHRTLAMKIR